MPMPVPMSTPTSTLTPTPTPTPMATLVFPRFHEYESAVLFIEKARFAQRLLGWTDACALEAASRQLQTGEPLGSWDRLLQHAHALDARQLQRPYQAPFETLGSFFMRFHARPLNWKPERWLREFLDALHPLVPAPVKRKLEKGLAPIASHALSLDEYRPVASEYIKALPSHTRRLLPPCQWCEDRRLGINGAGISNYGQLEDELAADEQASEWG